MKYSFLYLAVFMFLMAYINPHIWNWFVILGILSLFVFWYFIEDKEQIKKDTEEFKNKEEMVN